MTDVPTSNWVHLVATFNGSDFNLYVDGKLDKAEPIATPGMIDTNNACVFIGVESGGCSPASGQYFNGLIDEVGIYEGALTSAQIQKLYAEGLERHKNLTKK